MRAPILAVSALLLATVVALALTRREADIRPLPPRSIEIPILFPMPDILSRELATIASEIDTAKILAATGEAASSQSLAEASVEAAPARVVPASPPQDKQQEADALFLEERYSEFAYLGSGGSVSGKRIGTFHSIASGERKTALEGGTVHMLHIDKIEEEHVLLSYGKAEPVKKPKVTLEIDQRAEAEASPEEKQARETRYKELWGNRFLVEARRHARENGMPEVQAPSPDQEAEARKRYMETYAVFFQKLKAGDPSVSPRDFPNPDQHFEENVRRYFETQWPNQVEVTTEPANPSNPSSGGN